MKKRSPHFFFIFHLVLSLVICQAVFAAYQIPLQTPLDVPLPDGGYINFYVEVPPDATRLIVQTTEATGDVDIFVAFGEPFQGADYSDLFAYADFYSIEENATDEMIEISLDSFPSLREGLWYVVVANYDNFDINFTLTAVVETSDGNLLPLPMGQSAFPMYDPVASPNFTIVPRDAKPIGCGEAASAGPILSLKAELAEAEGPIDLYAGVFAPPIDANEIFLFGSDGGIYPYSTSGLIPWRRSVKQALGDKLIPDIPLYALPGGPYYMYFMMTPANDRSRFSLWSTYFIVPNVAPEVDVVVDDVVIDFGRLDGVPFTASDRRVLGVGPAVNLQFPPNLNPLLAPNMTTVSLSPTYSFTIPNLCLYGPTQPQIPVTTYLKTLPIIEQTPSAVTTHFNPSQYPGGMTCVYGLMADADSSNLAGRFIIPEVFGRGNLYTAIPIPNASNPVSAQIRMSDGTSIAQRFPDGYPAGGSLHEPMVMEAYSATLSYYASQGWLPIQAPSPLVFPPPPLDHPNADRYVIGFMLGRQQINKGQTIIQAPWPAPPWPRGTSFTHPWALGGSPSGVVSQVILEKGRWEDGSAKGYLWLEQVYSPFWDSRLQSLYGVGDAGLYVDGVRVAEAHFAGTGFPVIWEAPDDPNMAFTTHDKRHTDPGSIVNGGTVYLQARANDGVDPEQLDNALVAYPEGAALEIEKTVYRDHNNGASCPGTELVSGPVGTPVTYCFVVRNTGTTYLNQITLTDNDLNINQNNLTLISGTVPLAPGASLVAIYETTIQIDLVNSAQVQGNPCYADGTDIAGQSNPRDSDTAEVKVSTDTNLGRFNWISIEFDEPYLTYLNSDGETWEQYLTPFFRESATGSFSGGRFTANWDYSGTATYKGSCTAIVDPETLELISLEVSAFEGSATVRFTVKGLPRSSVIDDPDTLRYFSANTNVCNYVESVPTLYWRQESGLYWKEVTNFSCVKEHTLLSVQFEAR